MSPDRETPYEKICGCGRKILMVRDEKGTIVPIDSTAPIYRPKALDPEGRWERIPDGGVSHFKTCPNAEDYTRTKKARI